MLLHPALAALSVHTTDRAPHPAVYSPCTHSSVALCSCHSVPAPQVASVESKSKLERAQGLLAMARQLRAAVERREALAGLAAADGGAGLDEEDSMRILRQKVGAQGEGDRRGRKLRRRPAHSAPNCRELLPSAHLPLVVHGPNLPFLRSSCSPTLACMFLAHLCVLSAGGSSTGDAEGEEGRSRKNPGEDREGQAQGAAAGTCPCPRTA